MNAVEDLRLLNEMAEEIEKYGCPSLPGSLRSLIRVKRSGRVAALLEAQAHEIIRLREEIDGPIALEIARLKAGSA
jgi:hypothetical protein